MRVFIAVLVLIFSLQSWTKADDISEFEIEGMSIGDSLLDYYSEDEIKEKTNKVLYAGSNKKFSAANIYKINKDLYAVLQVHYKTNDKKFTIYGIDGVFAYGKEPNYCNEKRLVIISSILNIFSNLRKEDDNDAEMASGRGYMDRTQYFFKNEDFIEVVCYKYKVPDYTNHGRVGVVKKELDEWIASIE